MGQQQGYKAEVPGNVHTDLMANGVIPDPFYHDLLPNEKKVVKFTPTVTLEEVKRSIKIKSLVDTY